MMRNKTGLLLGGMTIALLMAGCNTRPADTGINVNFVDRPSTVTANAFYASNKAPLQPSSFVKLPIGSIRPEGWVLKCLQLEKNGMTGHLDQISAWLEKKDNAWLSPDGKGIHGWEEVPYWLKGYADMGYVLGDSTIIRKAKVWINAVLGSQRADGYFGPVSISDGTRELWPNMIMLWCLQSYYEYSGDSRVLPFMTNYFKWEAALPDSAFLQHYWGASRGGDNLYSVYWLYNRTGEKWLLDLAEKIHKHTANWGNAQGLPNWHNVNIAQGFREPATYYLQSGDSVDLRATYHDFHLVRNLYGQVPGGMFGADENARPGYADPHQGIETCGMVEQMNSDEMLLRFTGDSRWADNCENVTFNTYPAALMPNFKALRYFTAPNMVVSDAENHSPGIQNKGPFFMMNPLSNRCCQHNHAQGWPYYAENLWMATPDNGLAAVLYAASAVSAKVGDGTKVTLQEQTHYPFSQKVSFTVHIPHPVRFPVYLRIPGWCQDAAITVNGKRQEAALRPDGYARLENTWKEGDQITLEMPMKITLHKWVKNKNSVSVNYGPLTFSLKIKERIEKADPEKTALPDSHWQPDVDTAAWPAYDIYPASAWNYGLLLKNSDPARDFKIIKKPWPANDFPFTPQSVPIELIASGKPISSWRIDNNGLCGVLPESPVTVTSAAGKITLLPMGATRLRISAFPVVK
jgi:hypothetical protein